MKAILVLIWLGITLPATAGPTPAGPAGPGSLRPEGASPPAPASGAGACCLMDDCVPAADAAECAAMGGVFLPGEECADGACGVGACCAGQGCAETDAYSCIAGGRVFAGAGTTCEEDPCDIGVGACCLDGDCEVLSPEDCADAGGVFREVGRLCGLGDCDISACCLPDECVDIARYACDDLGGVFVEDLSCAEDACQSVLLCPGDTLFGQLPDPPEFFIAGTSERSAGFARFEDFSGVAGPILEVTWWGLDLDNVGGNDFRECVETDLTFEIGFYEDAGGVPGDPVCFYKLSATRTPLGLLYNNAELNEYHAVLQQPCVLVNGWVSIVGLGDPECWFLWMSAGGGVSYCDNCQPNIQGDDFSFCLQGTVGGVFGACCDDADGTCTDDVEITDCLGASQRFVPDGQCEELEPECGVLVGACCIDAGCEILGEDDCDAAGGGWLGAGARCEQCPCATPCPPGARPENEPRCDDGYVDIFNGGCIADAPAFSPIEFGDVVCGESGVYDDGFAADFDWYELEVEEAGFVFWSVEAEFPPRLLIIEAGEGCPGQVINETLGFACQFQQIVAPVEPGTYWLVVVPWAFTDGAGCGSRYTATVGPDPCPEDIDRSGEVDFSDLLRVLAAWGSCEGCREDIDDSRVVDFNDVLLVLAAWGPCE